MKIIRLEIPESLLWQTGESSEQLRARAQFLLALKFFELGQITSGQAAELSKVSRVEFLLRRVSKRLLWPIWTRGNKPRK
jgi:hypothetical protein